MAKTTMAEENSKGRAEGFLARWARRKRAAREGLPVAAEPDQARPPQAASVAERGAAEDEPVDLDALPKIEEISLETDLSVFFRKGVPAALRNAALRRAWSLDPAIRDFVGPADYAWDWNTPGGVPDFCDGVGETPAIRTLVERMLSPPSAGSGEDETRVHAGDATDVPAAGGVADAAPAPADAGPVPPAPTARITDTTTTFPTRTVGDTSPADTLPPALPPPRRHGGALPA